MITRICQVAGCPELVGKRFRYCEAHRVQSIKKISERISREKLVRAKLSSSEMSGRILSSPVRQASVMKQKEVPALLAVWEAMDALLAQPGATTQDLEALVDSKLPKPISHQAVQQIERSALLKLRKALGPTYKQVLADGGMPSQAREYHVAAARATQCDH